MNNIQNSFSINDLENLSGIKAHTIRIWEKRYNILSPERASRNIRYYDISNLKKLLNVTLLYKSGVKISKIAALSKAEIQNLIREEISKGEAKEEFLSGLKIAMLNFDSNIFDAVYNKMLAEMSFRQIFIEVFAPFLNSVGLDWQSAAIIPSHEHFISNLIKQKLHINIERVQQTTHDKDKVYVLFLPLNEIHDLGLMYIHYALVLKGYHSIYLGQSVPMENTLSLQNIYKKIHFISYFTVKPEKNSVLEYLEQANDQFLKNRNDTLWVLGRNMEGIELDESWKQIKRFNHITELLEKIE